MTRSTSLSSGFDDVAHADDIGLYRIERSSFAQYDVFQSRGVQDDVHSGEHAIQFVAIADISDLAQCADRVQPSAIGGLQFLLKEEDFRLVGVDCPDFTWLAVEQLSNQLTADSSTGTSHQNCTIRKK